MSVDKGLKPSRERRNKYNRTWRQRHPEYFKAYEKKRYATRKPQILASHRLISDAIRDYLRRLKQNTSCRDCNRYDAYYLMDFDHRDGRDSTYRSPLTARSWPEMWRELTKCDIVCVRCHRIRTHVRQAAQKHQRK